MSRFVVDVGVVLRMIGEDIEVAEEHELLAPTLLRSQVVDTLYQAVRDGAMSDSDGRETMTRFVQVKMRYLGDAVLRETAWKVARQLEMDSTYGAEYIALTILQADALVTDDKQLARHAAGLVETVSIEALKPAP